jgi:hypothetical protein
MDLRQYRYASETSRMLSIIDKLDLVGIKYDLQVHVHQSVDRQNKEFIDYEIVLPAQLDKDFGIKIKINKSKCAQSIPKFLELATKIASGYTLGKDPVEDWTQDTYSDRFKYSEIYKSQLCQQPRSVEIADNIITIPLNITASSFLIFKALLAFDENCLNDYGSSEFYELYRNSVFDDQTLQLNVFDTINHLCKVFPEADGIVHYKIYINGFKVSCEWHSCSIEECNFQIQVQGDKTRITDLVSLNQFVQHKFYDDLAIHSFNYQQGMQIESYFADMIKVLSYLPQ